MASLCGVCRQQNSKYKCPRCELPTCSLPCSKTHKGTCSISTHAKTPDPPASLPPSSISNSQKQTKRSLGECFDELAKSSELESLLQRYPSLKPELASIYDATLESSQYTNPTRNSPHPEHRRGTFRGVSRGRFSNMQGPWTQQKGDNAALRLIKNARESDDTEHGQAMREFLALLHMKCNDVLARDAEVQKEPVASSDYNV